MTWTGSSGRKLSGKSGLVGNDHVGEVSPRYTTKHA